MLNETDIQQHVLKAIEAKFGAPVSPEFNLRSKGASDQDIDELTLAILKDRDVAGEWKDYPRAAALKTAGDLIALVTTVHSIRDARRIMLHKMETDPAGAVDACDVCLNFLPNGWELYHFKINALLKTGRHPEAVKTSHVLLRMIADRAYDGASSMPHKEWQELLVLFRLKTEELERGPNPDGPQGKKGCGAAMLLILASTGMTALIKEIISYVI